MTSLKVELHEVKELPPICVQNGTSGFVVTLNFSAPSEQTFTRDVVAPNRKRFLVAPSGPSSSLMAEGYREMADEARQLAESSLWAVVEVLPAESE